MKCENLKEGQFLVWAEIEVQNGYYSPEDAIQLTEPDRETANLHISQLLKFSLCERVCLFDWKGRLLAKVTLFEGREVIESR